MDYKFLQDSYKRFNSDGDAAYYNKNYNLAIENYRQAASYLIKIIKVSPENIKNKRIEALEQLKTLILSLEERIENDNNNQRSNLKYKNNEKAIKHEDLEEDIISSTEDKKAKGDDDITLDDIKGMKEVKKEIRYAILPFTDPDCASILGNKEGNGILLYGVPGTGKTMFAKAIKNELNAEFYEVKLSEVLDMYNGNTEKNIKEVFDKARKARLAIIFFDEFDALGRDRAAAKNEPTKALQELLAEMDGADSDNSNIIFLAATNRPYDIDSALKRNKRFDKSIFIDIPDKIARKEILMGQISKIKLEIEEGVDFDNIAEKLEGYTGADINSFVSNVRSSIFSRYTRDNNISSDDFKTKLDPEKLRTYKISRVDIRYALKATQKSVVKEEYDKLLQYKKEHSQDIEFESSDDVIDESSTDDQNQYEE